MINKLSQINLYEDEGYKGFGSLGLENNEGALSVFSKFISSTIGLITIIGIIWFIFTIILGGVGIITSGGDKAANENAKKKITSGLIGLVVIIAGIFIIDLIGSLIGLPDILNVEVMFNKIMGFSFIGNQFPH